MAARSKQDVSELTPMMQQYMRAKSEHPDAVLFFRMGDFYEMFYDDAVEVSALLGLTLTSRSKDRSGEEIPMAGLPHHAATGYVQRLLEQGKKVAICEQVEDPKKAKGIVAREVVSVVSPGINLDLETLDDDRHNYLAAAHGGARGLGLAFVDISTGTFRAAPLRDVEELVMELVRVEPRELLVDPSLETDLAPWIERLSGCFAKTEPLALSTEESRSKVAPFVRSEELTGPLPDEVIEAAAHVLVTLEGTRRRLDPASDVLKPYEVGAYMVLPETTCRHLELWRTMADGSKRGSLLGLMDKTRTPMGARLLRDWIRYPLRSPARIDDRLDTVAELIATPTLLDGLDEHLRAVRDVERLVRRAMSGIANARDLVALRRSLDALPELSRILEGVDTPILLGVIDDLTGLEDLADELARALVDEPPLPLKDGGLIRPGYSTELDGLSDTAQTSKDWMLELERTERKRTGISSLKVRFNRVFGYYLEVTKANLDKVPAEYIRKQTLANAERYFTEELKVHEERILGADERRAELEHDLFVALRDKVAARSTRLLQMAGSVALLDVVRGLAIVAREGKYTRPTITLDKRVRIVGGRHPVVEATLGGMGYVPNDVTVDSETEQLLILTGPNMAGKSTLMRQVALITIMAQMGSFVPCDEASIGVVDKVFTRVGASDNVAGGQSTFMVEMVEAAEILRLATERSLVLLDEIGRGTSTFDGVSIAWAVAEHIHDKIRARTLFATHYHELTDMALTKPRVKNYSFSVKEYDGKIIFLRRLREGGTNRSYGIDVARLAGLPSRVIDRARRILRNLESGELDERSRPRLAAGSKSGDDLVEYQLNLFAPVPVYKESEADKRLRELDLDTLTPRDALNLLYELKSLVPEESAEDT